MLYAIIAAVVIAADQFFKSWIVGNIPLGGYMELIPGIIHLTYVQNTGAAFSFFTDMRLFLIIVTSVMIVGVTIFMLKAKLSVAEKVFLSAALGGGIANLIDRIRLGYVVDMFETDFINYAVFNIADSFIVVGGIMFCILYITETIKEEKLKKESESSDGN